VALSKRHVDHRRFDFRMPHRLHDRERIGPGLAIWEPKVCRSPWTRTWGIPARLHAPLKLSRTSIKGPFLPGKTKKDSCLYQIRYIMRV
jgi:hypothetical protein